MTTSIKKKLGQFYTTNQEYILQGINIPENIKNIIEPFTGNGDLLKFIEKYEKEYNIECYDIDPKKEFIIKQDTIKNPPKYTNRFIITNPPYLARNKSKDKTLFDKFNSVVIEVLSSGVDEISNISASYISLNEISVSLDDDTHITVVDIIEVVDNKIRGVTAYRGF